MTKLQFLLISAIVSSAVLLILGGREQQFGWWSIALVTALTLGANRWLTRRRWAQVARWINHTTGRQICKPPKPYVRRSPKLLPPSSSTPLTHE
jgi:hypothetical protein